MSILNVSLFIKFILYVSLFAAITENFSKKFMWKVLTKYLEKNHCFFQNDFFAFQDAFFLRKFSTEGDFAQVSLHLR